MALCARQFAGKPDAIAADSDNSTDKLVTVPGKQVCHQGNARDRSEISTGDDRNVFKTIIGDDSVRIGEAGPDVLGLQARVIIENGLPRFTLSQQT
jgi:hypothetical protein